MVEKQTALVPFEQQYPALDNEVGMILRESLAPGETLGVSNLPTIKIPSGGGKNWEMPDGSAQAEIKGILVMRQPVRAYWSSAFTGGGAPPDCSSEDAVSGVGLFGKLSDGNPSGLCKECPMSKYGSGKDNGQGCRAITRLFLLTPEFAIPVMVTLPPTSFGPAQDFVVLNAAQRKHVSSFETIIGLTQAQNKGGITYSVAMFKKGVDLAPEQAALTLKYAQEMAPLFRGIAVSDQEV